jgi:hypothetical protein
MIEAEVLPKLTDRDLDKLGVLLGHRRKLLRAIANFKGSKRAPPRSPFRLRPLPRRPQLMPPRGEQ